MSAHLGTYPPAVHPTFIRERLPALTQFGIAAEPFPGYVNPVLGLHGLDVVLLTFVLRGEGKHVMGDVSYTVSGPSVGITRTGEKHSLVTGESGLDVVNVYLDPEYHPLPILSPPLDVALAALIPFSTAIVQRPTRLAQISLDNLDVIEPLLRLLVAETAAPGPGTGDALDGLRKLLLIACARTILEHGLLPEDAGSNATAAPIEAVRAYLERTYLQRHTLNSLAAMAHLEPTYFSRRFSALTGIPVTEYLARLRIRYAITQLNGTDRPVTEIAESSGFRDLSHFGRTFRRYTGTTPREYRRISQP
jgi:AraC-like DNA-binding protein